MDNVRIIHILINLLGLKGLKSQEGGGGYSGVKRIGMTVGNPRKLP